MVRTDLRVTSANFTSSRTCCFCFTRSRLITLGTTPRLENDGLVRYPVTSCSACSSTEALLTAPTSTMAPPTARASMSSRPKARCSSLCTARAGRETFTSVMDWPPLALNRIRFVSPTRRPMTSSPELVAWTSAIVGSVRVARETPPPTLSVVEPPSETSTTVSARSSWARAEAGAKPRARAPTPGAKPETAAKSAASECTTPRITSLRYEWSGPSRRARGALRPAHGRGASRRAAWASGAPARRRAGAARRPRSSSSRGRRGPSAGTGWCPASPRSRRRWRCAA
jgi:hypothetical protein